MHEYQIMLEVKHQSIVKTEAVFYDDPYLILVLEFCEYGELTNQISEYKKKQERMSEAHIIWILYQACDALAYTHKR